MAHYIRHLWEVTGIPLGILGKIFAKRWKHSPLVKLQSTRKQDLETIYHLSYGFSVEYVMAAINKLGLNALSDEGLNHILTAQLERDKSERLKRNSDTFDYTSRYYLNISGAEFLERYAASRGLSEFDPTKLSRVIAMLPFATPRHPKL